jgi:hypothetical protein
MEVMSMNNELYHHGIKGMHWGVRRYQNYDGSLTDAGRRRQNFGGSIGSIGGKDSDIRRDVKRQREWNAKNASQLSDKELVDQILRLQREKQLKDLTDQVVSPGKSHAKQLLQRYGDQALTAAVTTGITLGITNKLNKKFNPQKSTYERLKDQYDAESKLADEGYAVNKKGFKRQDGKWVPKD